MEGFRHGTRVKFLQGKLTVFGEIIRNSHYRSTINWNGRRNYWVKCYNSQGTFLIRHLPEAMLNSAKSENKGIEEE